MARSAASPSRLSTTGERSITYTRSDKRGVDHTLVAYAVDSLKPLKKRTWHEDADGQIKQGASSLKPLWWADGFTVLAALRAGEFDKTRDLRRPDRYTRLDALTGKVIAESEVQDVLGVHAGSGSSVAIMPNQPVIVRFSDDRQEAPRSSTASASTSVVLPRELWQVRPDDARVADRSTTKRSRCR